MSEVISDHRRPVVILNHERNPNSHDSPAEDESEEGGQRQANDVHPAQRCHQGEARIACTAQRAIDCEKYTDCGDAHGMDSDESHAELDDFGITNEASGDGFREREDAQRNDAHYGDRPLRGLPPTFLRGLRLPRSETLTDESRCGDGESESRHEGEALDPQTNLMGGEDLRPEHDDHSDPDEECDLEENLLECGRPTDAEDSLDGVEVDPLAPKVELQAVPSAHEDDEEDQRSDDVGDGCPNR